MGDRQAAGPKPTPANKMTKAQFSEYLDFLHATAVARGVDV